MKFLVLALCVCAASAAVLNVDRSSGYKPYSGFKTASKLAAPVVAPFAKAAAAVYQPAKLAAAAVYQPAQQAAAAVYEPAKQVVTKTLSSAAKEAEATIVRADSEVGAESYNYAYETSNGIAGQASGSLKKVGEETVLVSQGSYKYVDPEGQTIALTYVADENGFQPQSDILPVGPEIPEAIVRSLAYNAAHPAATVEKY